LTFHLSFGTAFDGSADSIAIHTFDERQTRISRQFAGQMKISAGQKETGLFLGIVPSWLALNGEKRPFPLPLTAPGQPEICWQDLSIGMVQAEQYK